jgi:hypothetical protein
MLRKPLRPLIEAVHSGRLAAVELLQMQMFVDTHRVMEVMVTAMAMANYACHLAVQLDSWFHCHALNAACSVLRIHNRRLGVVIHPMPSRVIVANGGP